MAVVCEAVPRLPFDYSPLPHRQQIDLPDGARVGVYILVNVEYFEPGKPALSLYAGTASFPVDPLNYGWRDYGPRVGIWRIFDLLDKYGIVASAALNSDVCEHYPEIIDAGRARKWAWVAHGKNNSTLQGGMEEAEERAYLRDVVEVIEQSTGARPQGWLGPSLTETENASSHSQGSWSLVCARLGQRRSAVSVDSRRWHARRSVPFRTSRYSDALPLWVDRSGVCRCDDRAV